MNSIYILKIAFLFSFLSYLITLFTVPFTLFIGKKFKIIDYPNLRKQHTKPIVRIGGIAISFGFILSSLIILIFNSNSIENSLFYLKLIALIFAFLLIGLGDDIFSLNPKTRLFLQFSLSAILWWSGLRIDNVNISFLVNGSMQINLPVIFSFLITCIWITGIINALNWFDGLDGLASGISIIVLFSLLLISLKINQFELSLIMSSLIGSLLAFLKFNYFPAKILMGDCGSYLLGSSLSIFSILIAKNTSFITPQSVIAEIPILSLGILIIDMTYVIFNRILNGRSPFFPDKSHLHHRLLNFGFSQKNVVNIIYLLFIFTSSMTVIYTYGLIKK